jgi:hypothetical protein
MLKEKEVKVIENAKFIVSNVSGNVGKSEACRWLLGPRVKNAEMISIESINSNGTGEAMDASRFDEIMERVMLADAAVVDVGSADFKEFMVRMVQLRGSHEDIDYFVLPVVPDQKQQLDTVKTIRLLRAMGVEPERIRVAFNMVAPGDDVRRIFGTVFTEAENATINPDVKIEHSPFYQAFKASGLTVAQLLSDTEDYRTKMKEEGIDPKVKKLYFDLWKLKGYFQGTAANLDRAFEALVA